MVTTADVSIRFIPVDELKFDPQNPRLPGNFDAKDEHEVLRWMLGDASLIELMGSIGQQGYFPGEPLLGVRDHDGKVVIVEGNRRLASTKLLLHPELAPIKKVAVQKVALEAREKPSTLPVLIYPKREDILSYLGYRHVTGIKAWDPLAKARYLQELYDIEPEVNGGQESKFRALARKIGSRADVVAKLLTGLALYEKIEECDFFDIKGLDESHINFSVLTTALNYSNIFSFLGLTSANDPSLQGLEIENLSDLTNWLFAKTHEGKTRIGESRNLSLLSRIVSHNQALKIWKDGASLDYAITFTETPVEIFRKSLFESQAQLKTARDYSHQVAKPEKSYMDILNDIRAIARDVMVIMEERQKLE